MKKLVLLMSVFILFVHLSPQARAGGCVSCCRNSSDDDQSSHPPVRPVTENDALLDSSALSPSAPTTSSSSALVLTTSLRLPDMELSIPNSFPIQNLPGEIVSISCKLASFYIYPSILAARTMDGYRNVSAQLAIESKHLEHYVTNSFKFIRQLGLDQSRQTEAEQVVQLIRQVVDKFPASHQNSYRFVYADRKSALRICLQLEENRVVMIFVPATTEQ